MADADFHVFFEDVLNMFYCNLNKIALILRDTIFADDTVMADTDFHIFSGMTVMAETGFYIYSLDMAHLCQTQAFT